MIYRCGREKFASKILSAFINDLTLPSPGVLKEKIEFTHPKIESIRFKSRRIYLLYSVINIFKQQKETSYIQILSM